MKIGYTKDFLVQLEIIRREQSDLYTRLDKQLKLFAIDPKHPSLRTHKLKGRLGNVWSISAGLGIRLLYVMTPDGALFFDVGSHDEVYRK